MHRVIVVGALECGRKEERTGRLQLLVSPDGADGSIDANTDARVYGAILNDGDEVLHDIEADEMLYVHVARGDITLNGEMLSAGDGASISDETVATLFGQGSAEELLFELPASV